MRNTKKYKGILFRHYRTRAGYRWFKSDNGDRIIVDEYGGIQGEDALQPYEDEKTYQEGL